jgi:hypothetical protein
VGDGADVGAQSRDDEADVGAESGDEDSPRIGQEAWVGNKWHDPLGPHPFALRESRSREEFDLDTNQIQVR